MSYQVLARKWRPQRFSQLVGQEHVVKALSNALDHDRLHHAYLFTGTRGVGKTTLARIFAKSLNCDQGVSATPCGACGSCREIEEGRFVDLLEVDAASRTKVDQTRELLENVPYAPVSGRYKVYLIDEVHMFSASSFNALLKTLEEPPPHVKFILATTDPQKVPVTVLSRCLQFNLKRLSREQIELQLRHILQQEQIPFDNESLALLARGADGSMRDGLSLLDQAIAFGGGEVKGAEVRVMIGTVATDWVYRLLDALVELDGAALLQGVAEMSQLASDFTTATQELVAMLHQIALLQQVPSYLPDEAFDAPRLTQFAERLTPEDVQLFYQIALTGQRELHLAPDPRSGFEMLLLRMLAFRPDGDREATVGGAAPGGPKATRSSSPAPKVKPHASPPAASAPTATALTAAESDPSNEQPASEADPSRWDSFVAGLKLGGIASQLAHHCLFESWDGEILSLRLDPSRRQLRAGQVEARLQEGIGRALGRSVKLKITEAVPESETPAMRQSREQNERQREAETRMANDPLVQELEEHFSARVVSESVRPLD